MPDQTITLPNAFQNDTTAYADQVMADLNAIVTAFNAHRHNDATIDIQASPYNAKCDGKRLFDGAITSGQATLTSATAAFTASDVGKTIVVQGAGAAAAALVTTINAFVSSSQVTLGANASTSVTNAEFHYATDDAAAIAVATAAAAAVGGTVRIGTGKLVGVKTAVNFGPSVNVMGAGGGKTSPASSFVALAAAAQVTFGDKNNDNRGGMSGSFHFDGGNVATQGLYFGRCVQRKFADLTVGRCTGINALFEAAQNCEFFGFDSEDGGSIGICFDYGAGNLRFFGSELRNNGGDGTGNWLSRQSGASPAGAFSVPTRIRFVASVIEQPATGAVYGISQTNGHDCSFESCDIAWTGLGATKSIVVVRFTDTSKTSDLLRFRSCSFSGTSSQTTIFDVQGSVGHGSWIVVEGYTFVENHLTVFSVDDNSTVDVEGLVSPWAPSSVTNLFANAGGGGKSWFQVARHRRRSNTLLIPLATGDEILDVQIDGESKSRLIIFGDGHLQWSDGTNAGATLSQTTAAGIQGLFTSGPVKIQGTTAVVAAGTGTPATAFADGSIFLQTDGAGTLVAMWRRVNSTWYRDYEFPAGISIGDGHDVTIGTTTGTKIGQASSKIGFYGVSPIVRALALTQTYATATRTHANPTASALTDAFGTPSSTIADVGGAFSQSTLNNNFQSIVTVVNQLITDLANAKQVLNAVIDDLQAYGLEQ